MDTPTPPVTENRNGRNPGSEASAHQWATAAADVDVNPFGNARARTATGASGDAEETGGTTVRGTDTRPAGGTTGRGTDTGPADAAGAAGPHAAGARR